jgi:hypothetical protein
LDTTCSPHNSSSSRQQIPNTPTQQQQQQQQQQHTTSLCSSGSSSWAPAPHTTHSYGPGRVVTRRSHSDRLVQPTHTQTVRGPAGACGTAAAAAAAAAGCSRR